MAQRQEKIEEIDEKTKEEVLKKLDKLGIEWYEASQAGNEAEKKNLLFAIFNLITEKAKVIKKNWRTQSDDFLGAVNLFYCNDLQKYNPNYNGKKVPFSEFVRSRISLRIIDNYDIEHENKRKREKREDGTIVTKKRMKISIEENADNFMEEGTGGGVYDEINASNKMRDPALTMDEDADICLLISLFITIPENLQGKRNNEAKRAYYRLFGTEHITGAIRLSPGNMAIKKHERDILSAIKSSFLNYYMAKICKTIQEIESCPMKLRKEVEKNSADEREVDIPFSNKLYIAYLDRIENRQVVDSTISNHKKHYHDDLLKDELLKEWRKDDYKN